MVTMVGENPIEFYYPDGFGQQVITPHSNNTGCLDWIVGSNLNYRYDGAWAQRTIYENTLIGADRRDCHSPFIRVEARYRKTLTTTSVPQFGTIRQITPVCTGGPIKYAYLSGRMPDTLTFNIDTGNFQGCLPELDSFLSEAELGSVLSPAREQTAADIEAERLYGFDYGDQDEAKYDEINYATGGSSALYSGGFGRGIGIPFIARAFDSLDPEVYIDGLFVLNVFNNWSSDRDSLILNIRNQMYLDGSPTTNASYLAGIKARGYFRDITDCPCKE